MVTIQNIFIHNLQTTMKSQRSKLPGHNVNKKNVQGMLDQLILQKTGANTQAVFVIGKKKSQLLSDRASEQVSKFISLTTIQTYSQASNRKAGGEKSCRKNPACAPIIHTPRAILALPSVLQMQRLINLCVVRHFQALHFNSVDNDILWMFPSPEAEAQVAA